MRVAMGLAAPRSSGRGDAWLQTRKPKPCNGVPTPNERLTQPLSAFQFGFETVSFGPERMSAPELDFDRYKSLLSEATDESKRLALIHLLIKEKAREKLAAYM